MIGIEDVINGLRFFNAVIGGFCFFWSLLAMSSVWSKLAYCDRAASMFFTITAFSISYAAIENIVLNAEYGARSVFHAFALVCLIQVLQVYGRGNGAAR